MELDILAEEVNGNYINIEIKGVKVMCEIADRIRNEGKVEGKAEAVLELLEDLGKVPQQIIGRIYRETDPCQLVKWLKNAAKATSIAEFETNM